MSDLWRRFKRDYLPYPFVYLVKIYLRLLLRTCRIEIRGFEQFVEKASKERCILTLWHNRLSIISEVLYRYAPQFIYCAVISRSRDGELLAILANSYKEGRTLRVPHDARHHALGKMISQLKHQNEVLVVTPDGPRGPRYKVKPGIIAAAEESTAAIVPFSWSANRFWQLSSWDKMLFPKPFSHVVICFGEPVYVKEGKETLAESALRVQERLLELDEECCRAISTIKNTWPK